MGKGLPGESQGEGETKGQEKFVSHDVGLSISYRICTKVSTTDYLWEDKKGDRKDTTDTVRKERRESIGAEAYPGHTRMLVSREYGASMFKGAFGREKFADDICEICKHEVSGWEPAILTRGLWSHGGGNQKAIEEYIANQIKDDERTA